MKDGEFSDSSGSLKIASVYEQDVIGILRMDIPDPRRRATVDSFSTCFAVEPGAASIRDGAMLARPMDCVGLWSECMDRLLIED